MKAAIRALLPLFVLGAPAALPGTAPQEAGAAVAGDEGALFRSLALRQEEREECLALALTLAMSGDCEAGLQWLDAASGGAHPDDGGELERRIALERKRLAAWIELRDAFLGELAAAGKPLALELDKKKVSTTFTREGDELVLARGPRKRLSVRALAPEPLLASIPKERFAGANEWLKIYPYCVSANPKWKRLTTSEASSAELKRDAEEFYPRLVALGPVVHAIERLSQGPAVEDTAQAQAVLSEIEGLLALGRDVACVRARLPALGALGARVLARLARALEVGDLVHAALSSPAQGTLRLTYDFSAPEQERDWRRDDGYLEHLRAQLEPVSADSEATRFAPGAQGFTGNGTFCWRHVLEFQSPLRVRYRVRWEPFEGAPKKVFAFALGMLGDAQERHLRAAELGFLYVDEQDGPYTAVRPKGDGTVQLGQTYAIEVLHDGHKVEVWVDGVLRSQAQAQARKQGRLFLWGHSDLRISVPSLEIEGGVTPASLDALRAEWVRARLAALGLDPGQ